MLEKEWTIPNDVTKEQIDAYAKEVADNFRYGSNMRGSSRYRKHLAQVLVARAMESIITEGR